MSQLRREQFSEWTLYEVANQRFPQYLKISSIKAIGDKVAVQTKFVINPSIPVIPGKQFPDNSYEETVTVFDCSEPRMAVADIVVFNKLGEKLYH